MLQISYNHRLKHYYNKYDLTNTEDFNPIILFQVKNNLTIGVIPFIRSIVDYSYTITPALYAAFRISVYIWSCYTGSS